MLWHSNTVRVLAWEFCNTLIISTQKCFRLGHENTLSRHLEGVFFFTWQTFGKQLIAWSLLPMPLNRSSEIWMVLDFTCYCWASTTNLHSFSRNLENFRSRSWESRTFAGPDPSRQNVRIGSFCPHKTTHDSHRYLNHRPRHIEDFAYCWLSSIYKAMPFFITGVFHSPFFREEYDLR